MLTCPTCSRINPGEALYCYFDGSALNQLARKSAGVDPGTVPFPVPFVFPAGQICRTFDQLALACLSNWTQTLEMLQNGDLPVFFGSLGRADLAQAAREAACFPDRDRGLDQLLARLPTQAIQPPKLHVEPQQINLGQLSFGEDQQWDLHLANLGMRLLFGSVTSIDCPWLALGDALGLGVPQKLFHCSQELTISVHVRGQQLRAGNKPLEGRLVIETNGGNATVVVSAEVPIRPFPNGVLAGAVSPRQIAEKAKNAPKEAAVLFESGSVCRWYKDNGWTYPVQGPSASGLGAVQQFFETLGLTSPPRVQISEQFVQFRSRPGREIKYALKVKTQERRPVYAHAVSDQSWLEVTQVILQGRSATIHFTIPTVPNRLGETLLTHLKITANGNQRFVVPITVEVMGEPISSAGKKAIEIVDVIRPVGFEFLNPTNEGLIPEVIPIEELPSGLSFKDHKQPVPKDRRLRRHKSPAPNQRSGKKRRWLHLLPLGFLAFGLFVTVVRDVFMKGGPVSYGEDEQLADAVPRLGLRFHDQEVAVTLGNSGVKPDPSQVPENQRPALWEPSMRFGLLMLNERDPVHSGRYKRLTFEEQGLTNNTCIRLDGNEWLFGERPFRTLDGKEEGDWPGRWQDRDKSLGRTKGGRLRDGHESCWIYDQQQILITQTAEIVPGDQSHLLDTCLIRYLVENHDIRPHRVGLRFLLDTYIGANDGVPFTIPGSKHFCDTKQEFNRPEDVPDFIQALELPDLTNPGTIAHIQLKLGGRLEPPARVTLGAWPNPRLAYLDSRCQQEKTLWEVPVLSMKTIPPGDSAVVIYWNEKEINPGERRELGFAYGLGMVSSGEGLGKLGLTVGGSFAPRGEFTVTAYVNDPEPHQTLMLILPENFQLVDSEIVQPVPPLPLNSNGRYSPVTWKVRAPAQEGKFTLKVQSSNGVSQTQTLNIKGGRLFD